MGTHRTRWFTTTEGLRLAASALGSPGAPCVLLLHGGGQTRHAWSKAIDQVAAAGYYAVGLDLRGHGESDWSPRGAYDPNEMARDIAEVLQEIAEPTVLVGASMGGQAALRALANCATENARAVILVDIVPNPARHGVRKVTDFMQRHLDGFASLEEVAAAVASYNPRRERPSDIEGLKKNVRLRADGRYYWHWDPRLLDIGNTDAKLDKMDYDTWAAAQNLTLPCLLLRGGDSDVVDIEAMETFRQRVGHAEIREVPRAGHMVAGDQNDAFNTQLLEFLTRVMPPVKDTSQSSRALSTPS